jgi:CHAT domain-containing protein
MTRPAERASWSLADYAHALERIPRQASAPLAEAMRLESAGKLEEACQSYRQFSDVLELGLALALELDAAQAPPPAEMVRQLVASLVAALSMRARVEEMLGRRAEAERLRGDAQRLAARYVPQDDSGQADLAQRKLDLAREHAAQSRYQQALTLLTEARGELEQRDDAPRSAEVVALIAEILQWLGDTKRARDEAARSRELLAPLLASSSPSMLDIADSVARFDLEAANRSTQVLPVWLRLAGLDARLSHDLREYERADELYREMRRRVPQDLAPGIDFLLAGNAIAAGRAHDGLQALDALVPAFTGDYRRKLGMLHHWRARALLDLGRAPEALAAATTAVTDLSHHADLDCLWQAQWVRATALLALHQPDEAFAQLGDALATIADLRRGTLGHRLDSLYLTDKLPVIEAALELALQGNKASEACRIIESVKARALTAILGLSRSGDADTGSQDDFDAMSRQLDGIEYQISASEWSPELQAQRATLLEQRATLLQRRAALIEQARIADPRWRSLSTPAAFDEQELGARLREANAAALTLYSRRTSIVAVVVDGTGCAVGAHELSEDTQSALDDYRRSLSWSEPFDPGSLAGLALERLLPTEVLERALGGSSLAIAPHGSLHLLPWGMLRYQGKRLFEHRPISLVPNLTWLARVPRGGGAVPAIALFGNPAYANPRWTLPRASDELHAIESAYGHARVIGGRPVEGPEATEEAFRAIVSRADAEGATLHVTCHGDFVEEEPLYSGLLLADGKVDAAEISRTRLPYHEVVLSACSTGRRPAEVGGVPLRGDDVVGLVGAFLEAGARTVVVSITRTGDEEACAFMTTYHRLRAECHSPVRALQETQRKMLEAGMLEPARWVGFVVYGV